MVKKQDKVEEPKEVEEVQEEVSQANSNVTFHTERWGNSVNQNVSQSLPSLDD